MSLHDLRQHPATGINGLLGQEAKFKNTNKKATFSLLSYSTEWKNNLIATDTKYLLPKMSLKNRF
jgi:hypothetical protein